MINYFTSNRQKLIVDAYDQPVLLNPALAQGYRLAICDDSVSLPTVMTPEIVRRASVFSNMPIHQRPKLIFDYLQKSISYGISKRLADYSSGIEVWENREGVCGEMTYLYISMARFAGLRANYASVITDYSGKDVNHACAVVQLNKPILVDIAYRRFDVTHKKWNAITDEKAWELFKSWR